MKATGNIALVDADLTGRRSIAVILEAVRSLDAARTNSAVSSVRADGVTVVELVDRLTQTTMDLNLNEVAQHLKSSVASSKS